MNNTRNRSFDSNNGRGQNGSNYGNKGARGRLCGKGSRSNGNKLICQLCDKKGHIASICWNKFDRNFIRSSINQNPNALMVTPETIEDPSWYAYTGASHHVINNPQKLQHKQDYNCKNSLIVPMEASLVSLT